MRHREAMADDCSQQFVPWIGKTQGENDPLFACPSRKAEDSSSEYSGAVSKYVLALQARDAAPQVP